MGWGRVQCLFLIQIQLFAKYTWGAWGRWSGSCLVIFKLKQHLFEQSQMFHIICLLHIFLNKFTE